MPDANGTHKERMAVALSRRLGAGRIIVGAASHIPIAAVVMAKDLYGHSIDWICSGTGFVNPRPAKLYPSSTQFDYREGATSVLPYHEIAALFERGFDYAFFGGLQVDGSGALNTTVTGSGGMGPGPAGLPVGMARTRNVLIYMTRHHPGCLVPQVAHATGRPADNVRAIVTPLAEFTLEGDKTSLTTLLDGTVEEVHKATGFDFEVAHGAELRQEMTREELQFIRRLDVDGLLR